MIYDISHNDLLTLKEVAAWLEQPPHRIIHLCECGVVRPTVDARGRGTMRRFADDEVFRIRLALNLQTAGIAVPTILPLMKALDRLLTLKVARTFRHNEERRGLVQLIRWLGTDTQPCMAWLCPPDQVTLVSPKADRVDPHGRVPMTKKMTDLMWCGVGVTVNLTMEAEDHEAKDIARSCTATS